LYNIVHSGFFSAGLISKIWYQIWSEAMNSGDVFLGLNVFIVGHIAVTPIIVFIVAPLFGMEIVLEKRIRLTNVVIIDAKPKTSVFSVFLYSYIMFGVVVIITRILSTGGQGMMGYYLMAAGVVIRTLIPFILLFLVSPYILRDLSSIRSLRKNLIVAYPSRLQQFILTIVIGMGSIAALAPIYTELVTIVGDPSMALVFFIYIILMTLVPSITVVIGFLIGSMIIAKPFFQKSIEKLEKIVKKYGKAKTISLTENES